MKKIFVVTASLFLILLFAATLGSFAYVPSEGVPQDVNSILAAPSHQHIFGTDTLGRDLLARVIVGGRVSLLIGLVCSFLTFSFGFVYGGIAGWFEGIADKVMMRFCDILMSVPTFILVSVICFTTQLLIPIENPHVVAILGLCIGISATHWMSLARVTRGMVLEIKRKPFVEAAIALGGTRAHILIRHILPNMISTLLVLIALQIPTNILYESFMSFIGLGVHPPYTSWGILVREGWKTLSSFPHLILFPSLILFLSVWSFHILLDHMRDRKV